MTIIRRIASELGLFRERDVKKAGASPSCLEDARVFGIATPHGHGVWSHPDYKPSRYELIQIRLTRAVFCGPSALWLLGVQRPEPESIWIALSNNWPRPGTLELGTVVIRTRNLERDVEVIRPTGGLIDLRVHSRERAQADLAQADGQGLIARALRPDFFRLDSDAELLSSRLRMYSAWRAPCLPPEGWEEDDPKEEWFISSSIPKLEPNDSFR